MTRVARTPAQMRAQQQAVEHAEIIADLQRRLTALERASSLAHSSIEDGALQAYDADGNHVLSMGRQFDGSNVATSLSGPTPPTPSAPNLVPFPGGLSIEWDGYFVDSNGAINPYLSAPMDFKQVDVVVTTSGDDDFIGTPPTQSIMSPRGGVVFVSSEGTDPLWVALVTRTQPGNASDVSPIVSATPLELGTAATEAATNIALAALAAASGNVHTFEQPEMPWPNGSARPTGDVGALWIDNDDPALPTYRWVNATWTLTADNGYSTAVSLAQAASDKVDAALTDSGWVDCPVGAGMVLNGVARVRKIGRWVHLEVYSIDPVSPIPVTAGGGLSDTVICTLPAGFWPTTNQRFGGYASQRGAFYIASSLGNVTITAADGYGTATSITDRMQTAFTWIVDP